MAITGIGHALEKAASGPVRKLTDESPRKVLSKPTRKLTDEHEMANARKACQEFEAIFIHKMLSSMRAAFESEKGEDKDFGGDMFKSMMDEQLGIALARAGGIGLANMLGKSLGIEDDSLVPEFFQGCLHLFSSIDLQQCGEKPPVAEK